MGNDFIASLRDVPHLSDIFLKYKLFWSILILFEIIKEDLVRKNKTIHDYNDEEMEGMIVDAEKELKNDQLVTILVGIAALEGVSLIIG